MLKLPDHLFCDSCAGSLFDTRMPNWSANPVRADLGEFRSLHAAKIAITRDRREYLAKRAADHHEAIREIWGQK